MKMQVTGVVDVAAGAFTLALKDDGTVWGWGFNNPGILGHLAGEGGDVDCASLLPGDAGTSQFCNPTPIQNPNLP